MSLLLVTDAAQACAEKVMCNDAKQQLVHPGRWSVDMFAMFHLGRPNVLPVGDLGIRKGMQTLYGLKVCLQSLIM